MRSKLTIRQKIWVGLGVTLLVLLIVSAQALFGYKRLESSLVEVVRDVQPLAMEALDLRYELEEGSDSLSVYLLTKEPRYREEYREILQEVGERLDALQANTTIAAQTETRELLAQTQQDFATYRALGDRMLPLATDRELNFPGVAIASKELNPVGEELRTLAAQMVAYAESEAVPIRLLQPINELRYVWANVMLQVRGYLGYRDPASASNLDLYMQQIPELIAKIRDHQPLPLEIESALDQFAQLFSRFAEPLARMRALHESERWRTDAYLLATEVAPLHHRIDEQLGALADRLRERITITSGESLDLASTGATLIAVLGGLALLLGLGAAWGISRLFHQRVCSAVTAMIEVAEGDGNLARRLDDRGHDEMSHLAGAFNKFVAKIKGVVDMVTQCSTGLSSEAEAMSRITAKTRDGAVRQQQEINEVTQAIAEMSGMVTEVAEHAGHAAESAREAAARSASGRTMVDGVSVDIEGLAAQLKDTADVIRELDQESASIGEVIAVIREIAEQTNLLALNAAIEAARAGDQGRGFAVVADEVRNLANRTHQGTEDIRHRIERLQQRSRDAVAAMESGDTRVQHSVEQAREARSALDAINEAVSQITELNQRIAEATTRQTAVSDQISGKAEVIREIADATATDARQTSAGSHELNLLAAQMEGLVTEFLLNETDRAGPGASRSETDSPAAESKGDVELF